MTTYGLATIAFSSGLFSVHTTPDGKIVFVTGDNGYTGISYDYGLTFQSAGAAGTSPKSVAAISTDATVIHCGDWAGKVYSYYSGNWHSATAPSSVGLNGLVCDATGQYVWVIPDNNYFYYSTNYGATWTTGTSISNGWGGLAVTPDRSVMLFAPNGNATTQYLRISTNGGVTLTNLTGSGKGTWADVALSDNGQIMYASKYAKDYAPSGTGPIMMSTNGGTTWTTTAAPSAKWCSIDCTSDGTTVLAGTSDGLTYLSLDTGTTWTSLVTSSSGYNTDQDPGCCCVISDGSYLYSAFINGSAGILLRYPRQWQVGGTPVLGMYLGSAPVKSGFLGSTHVYGS